MTVNNQTVTDDTKLHCIIFTPCCGKQTDKLLNAGAVKVLVDDPMSTPCECNEHGPQIIEKVRVFGGKTGVN